MPHEITRDDRGGFMVSLDGHPQSYVDTSDPGLLAFEYVQHLALALDALPAGRLRVTHIGGAGLTLPRYVEHTRPGSPQIVLEPDIELTQVVREQVPLPRRHRIRVRPVAGEVGITNLTQDSADVVVLDAFERGRVPGELLGARFSADVARVLAPGGLFVLNICDEPHAQHARRVVATVSRVLPMVGLICLTEFMKGRRFGNLVVLASDRPLAETTLSRRAASSSFPTRFLGTGATRAWLAGAAPFGADGDPSPTPPDPGTWRLR